MEHIVFGTLLGMVQQLTAYLAGVAIGVPRLTLLLAIAVVNGCLPRGDHRSLRPDLEPVNPI